MDTGKKILNEKKEHQTKTISIRSDEKYIHLTINKEFLTTKNNFEIYQSIMLATSPIFTNENKVLFNNRITAVPNKSITKKLFPHIAFFIENKSHYTGGRYSMWQQAVLLSNVADVTIVTNAIPKFRDDFKPYETDFLKIIVNNNYLIDNENNEFDLIIGVPIIAGEFATQYAKKFNLPLYLQLFESPNWVKQFRDSSPDATEEFWSGYKECLKQADKILVPSIESSNWLRKWDEKFNDIPISVIYPCINQFAADYVKLNYGSKRCKNEKVNLVMSSRMTDFKSPMAIIKKLNKDKYAFHFIGKVWDITNKGLEELKNKGYDITVHGMINDVEKFKILADCDILIHPSIFEGYGMPPLEGFYANRSVIAYDLPVLREIYGDNIIYAKLGDANDFANKIEKESEKIKNNGCYYADSNVIKYATVKYNLSCLMTELDIPKITAGMIVYNGMDYIKQSIGSIYKNLFELIIVEGAVKGYTDENNYTSADGTIKYLEESLLNDHIHKINLIKKDKFWENKIEMQNHIAENVNGDFYLKLDHDEIWKPETLIEAINEFYKDKNLIMLKMPFYHFWLNFKTIAKDAGGKWSTCHPRLWRWKKSYKHTISFNHFIDTENGLPVISPSKDFIGDRIYHFGYVRKLKILQNKIHYYSNRGIEKFVQDTVTDYSDGKPTQPTQKVESWAIDFEGTLPKILDNHPYKSLLDIRKYQDEE